MLVTIAIIAAAILISLLGVWWAYYRPTKVVLPQGLTEAVETEDFRTWLNDEARWFAWGRETDGCYYAIAAGSVAARTIRERAMNQNA